MDADNISDVEITRCAKETLLTSKEVKMWFSHLAEVSKRRKMGAKKAAATRQAKNGNYII